MHCKRTMQDLLGSLLNKKYSPATTARVVLRRNTLQNILQNTLLLHSIAWQLSARDTADSPKHRDCKVAQSSNSRHDI